MLTMVSNIQTLIISVTMASNEIDNFVKEYKGLCQAGRSASLNFSSNAGKVSIILRVDLGVLEEGPHLAPQPFLKWTCTATSQGETSSRSIG